MPLGRRRRAAGQMHVDELSAGSRSALSTSGIGLGPAVALAAERDTTGPTMQSAGDLCALLAAAETSRPGARLEGTDEGTDVSPPIDGPGCDGRFTLTGVMHSLGRGLVEPFTALWQALRTKPVRTLLLTAVKLATFVIASPVTAAWHLFEKIVHVTQIGRAIVAVKKHLQSDQPDDAERKFEDIGEAVSELLLHGVAEHVGEGAAVTGAVASAWSAILKLFVGSRGAR